MMIPFGRRRLSISFVSTPDRDLAGPALIPAESDAELVRLASRRSAVKERAEQDISRLLYAGPPVR
jgi:hypothetical protein